jgi:predicted acetyltransferase
VNVELKLVKEEEKRVLANMLQLYLHDITRFLHMEMNNEGLYEYKYLDNYWTNKEYIPYFIIADNKIAFTGMIDHHPDETAIVRFLESKSIIPVFLTKRKCFDIGSIIPLIEF